VRILLVKLNHLGDTLLLTPTTRFLRQQYPEAEIDVLVRAGCEDMLRGNPDITRIIPLARPEKHQRSFGNSLKEFTRTFPKLFLRRYDYAFDLSDSDRAKTWIMLSAAKVRGINNAYESLNWKGRLFNRFSGFKWGSEHQVLRDFRTVTDVIGTEAKAGALRFEPQAKFEELSALFPGLTPETKYAVIHPTSRWAFKQWFPDRWAKVADELHQQHGLTIIFSCGPDAHEKEYVQSILKECRTKHFSSDGRLSLHQFGLLIKGAKIFLGVDTVAMHLSAAVQTPTLALFGPSSEWSWHPWQVRHELVLGDCPCKQTRQFTCDKSKPYPCMGRITEEQVLAKAEKLLQPI
jgi:heptosyltransferase-3